MVHGSTRSTTRQRVACALRRGRLRTALTARLADPPPSGSTVAFLASDGASWITGETLVIDGGQILGKPASDGAAASVA